MAQIKRRPGTVYAALVPNDKGAVRAVDAGVDVIHTVCSASESHNLANVNMTVDESLGKLRAVMEVARRANKPVYSGISCTSAARSRPRCRCPARARGARAGRHGRARHRARRHYRDGQSGPGAAGDRAPVAALPRGRVDAPHPRHPRHGDPEHPRRDGARRDPHRRVHRRPRRLPVRAGRLRQRLHRGPRALPALDGRGDRRRPRRARRDLAAGAGDHRAQPARPDRQGRHVGPEVPGARRRAARIPAPA